MIIIIRYDLNQLEQLINCICQMQVNAMMSQRPGSPSKSKGKFYHAWEMEKQQAAQVGLIIFPLWVQD